MKPYCTLAAILALTLGACAKGPGSIAPVSMGNAYQGMPCAQAQRQLIAERGRLASVESSQRSAVAADAVGVFFLLVPVGSLTGNDVAGEVATSKGKVLALENRLSNC